MRLPVERRPAASLPGAGLVHAGRLLPALARRLGVAEELEQCEAREVGRRRRHALSVVPAKAGTTAWLRRRIHLSASTPEIALTQVNIEPGADDDGGADDGGDFGHVAEHDEAEDHRPDDHRILIGHDDAGRSELE